MLRKSSEAKYLDNLLRCMESDRYALVSQCPSDRAAATGWIASSLADLVCKTLIAAIIRSYAASKSADKRFDRVLSVLEEGRRDAFALAGALGVDMQDVVKIGREESERYLEHIGGDVILQFEYGLDGYAAYRRRAVRTVIPGAESVATSAEFNDIIRSVW